MNPRLFCRERSYHKALLLTYSFDPVFFEQIVLPDLRTGYSSDVLVLGDHAQIIGATQAASGQLWQLGKSYLLASANHSGAFHPKVILRLNDKEGAIMVGSGNLTSSGWGGNQELGTAWMFGPNHQDDGAWLHAFLDDLIDWCQNDLERDAIRRMREVRWLSKISAPPERPSPLLHSRPDHPLASSLAQRWLGRRFDEVKLMTGSTDESGAFLRWAHREFGIKRATVALTPAMASFDREKLADLPIGLRIIEAPPERTLHAKFYWFEGPDTAAAIMGSANCSAAGWLLPSRKGGNVEAVVVYDAPAISAFSDVLSIFNGPVLCPDDWEEMSRSVEKDDLVIPPGYVLTDLQWHSTKCQLGVRLKPEPSPGASIDLMIGNAVLPMSPSPSGGLPWACNLLELPGGATAFACAQIHHEGETWTTPFRWIDDVTALLHAGQTARLLEPFKALERDATTSEKHQMLADLHELADALFNDRATFCDPRIGVGQPDQVDSRSRAAVFDPNQLVVHLSESPQIYDHARRAQGIGLSLTGILNLLFDSEADKAGAAAAQDDDALDEGSDGGDKDRTQHLAQRSPARLQFDPAQVENRFQESLANQMATFLERFSSDKFATQCTATQLVQAAAFPLVVALRGRERGWVMPSTADAWARKVFSVLLLDDAHLSSVQERYATAQQQAVFEEVVGDGTLWTILLATVGNMRWAGLGSPLERAIALREVFSSRPLLQAASQTRIRGLLTRIRIADAQETICKVAPEVTRLLATIEDFLRQVWAREAASQVAAPKGNRKYHGAGDLLWREAAGWAICLELTPMDADVPIPVRWRLRETGVMKGYYVNVSRLSLTNAELASLLAQLKCAVG